MIKSDRLLAFAFESTLAVGLEYRTVAIITILLRSLWLALLATLFWKPSLGWLLIISALYNLVHAGIWFVAYRRQYAIVWNVPWSEVRSTVSSAVGDYGLWQHLAFAARGFLMRGDLLLLGLLGIELTDVGNYLIGLNIATFALILPVVLEMTTTAGLAHSTDVASDRRIVRRATGWNLAIIAAQLILFQLFASPVMGFLAGPTGGSAVALAWPLVLGTSLFGCILPLHAQAMVRGSTASFWWRVYLPVALLACASFLIGAWGWALAGVAWAHVANSLLFGIGLLCYLRRSI